MRRVSWEGERYIYSKRLDMDLPVYTLPKRPNPYCFLKKLRRSNLGVKLINALLKAGLNDLQAP